MDHRAAFNYYARVVLRVVFVTMNNLYCIPTYALWMLLLLPLRYWKEELFWRYERTVFKALLSMVANWSWSAGYTVEEVGVDVSSCYDQECLVVVNHQSTADVPLLMAALHPKGTVVDNMMWIMDHLFKYTNFGLVSALHGDFFIRSGKNVRDSEINKLKEHLVDVYSARRRKWVLLFPEGGFLRKRKETSQRYATKMNLPNLEHVSLPRLGAMHAVVNTLHPVSHDPSSEHHNHVTSQCDGKDNTDAHCSHIQPQNDRLHHRGHRRTRTKMSSLKWVIDITIGYPNKEALDLATICSGSLPPRKTVMHYRTYPIEEVPRDIDGMSSWMYERWFEKEKMLDEFYRTGQFPETPPSSDTSINNSHHKRLKAPRLVQLDSAYIVMTHMLFILSTIFHYHVLKWIFNLTWG